MQGRPLKIKQCADQLGIDPSTVRKWISCGDLPANRVCGLWFVDPIDWELFINKKPEPRPAKAVAK